LDAQLFFLVSSFPLWSLGEIQNSLAIASPLKKRIKNVAIKKLRVLWVVLLMTTTGALRRTLLTLRGIRASTLATSSPTVSSTHFMFGLFGLFNALTIFYRSYAPAWECRQGRSASRTAGAAQDSYPHRCVTAIKLSNAISLSCWRGLG